MKATRCSQANHRSQALLNGPRDGFSVVELLIVVAMLAVLTAVSMPIFATTFKSSRFNGAVRQLSSDIRYARSLAISKGGFYGVHLGRDPLIGDPALYNSYRIEYRADDGTWPVTTAAMGSPGVITNWQNLSTQYTGVTVQSVVDGSAALIGGPIFNAMGASVVLANAIRSVSITLADGSGATKVIQISHAGNVKMP